MLGLRTKENNSFKKFFEKVQDKASSLDSVFFLDFGECQDLQVNNMEVDTLFGWLIPNDKVSLFEKEFLSSRKIDDSWDDFCIWVIPEIKDKDVQIKFM